MREVAESAMREFTEIYRAKRDENIDRDTLIKSTMLEARQETRGAR